MLKIGAHTPRYPIIQGGMGVKVSSSRLAGAVAANGGIGTIASVGLACDHPLFDGKNYFDVNEIAMSEAVKAARASAPAGVIAVNCMTALTDYDRQVKSACRAGVDIIFSGAGLPTKLPEYTKDFPGVALVPIVSSVRAADLVIRKWKRQYDRLPDAIVVETPLYAGGHLGATRMEHVTDGAFSLEHVIPELVKYLEDNFDADIPVVGAGGVWDRADMDGIFALGARGVQMGTRFVCTAECDASDRFKQAYIDARKEDITVIMSPVGIPGRALKTPFVEKYMSGEALSKPCMAACLSHCKYLENGETFCIAHALVDAYLGDWENGLFFAGSNAWRCSKIDTVAGMFEELAG
ncbi:MAG: nitronate monooxygenase family protein [Synergistaceae bacterium]|jgi:nitronate monooxygenase|nr:nitronate monooxygenase family protein [Synergistaceae bacterium]